MDCLSELLRVAIASFGKILRDKNVANHSRRTTSAETHTLLLTIRVLRSALASSVMGPLTLRLTETGMCLSREAMSCI